MPERVCDVQPCPMLQAAMNVLFTRDGNGLFNLVVLPFLPNEKGYVLPKPFLMPLEYCPFCGTRLEESWATKIQKRRHSLASGNGA